jgi:hypothetical protein
MDLGTASTEAEQESTNRFINGELSELHRLLRDDAQSIDTKATLVAGFAVAAITFLLNARRGPTWWGALGAYGSRWGARSRHSGPGDGTLSRRRSSSRSSVMRHPCS